MVDFTLTDEQLSMREMAHDFAEKEIRPVAWEYDRDGTWPQEIIEKAWELGLMNNHFPAEYGGPALGYLDGCLTEEELAWGCSGISTSVTCNGLATAPVILAASEELKKEYLGRLSGRTHTVHSGLCLRVDGVEHVRHEATRVTFARLDPADVDWYVETGEWRDRAGAYAVQGRGAAMVRAIDGDYQNVVGLPVPALLEAMAAAAIR